MLKVGFIGWRGMVGSVLMERMRSENDFGHFEFYFFSTSQVGQAAPDIGQNTPPILDAYDIERLSTMDIIISCQGGDYTNESYPKIRRNNWQGYWIDAASTLRMESDSVIVLDPVNLQIIEDALVRGTKNFIGSNCTVALMLMALGGLFAQDLVEWMTSMTYQAASGAGAKNMRELVAQMQTIGRNATPLLADPDKAILLIDRNVTETINSDSFPTSQWGGPLAASLIPWIDRAMKNGQTREEWKGIAETNKIIGRSTNPIPIDGQCVRIGAMRCHSQAFTIKLTKDVPLGDIESIIAQHNDWVRIIPNEKEHSIKELTPARVSGTQDIPIGRIRKLNLGPQYLTAFSVGDQLLWGAAEPLRRMLIIIRNYLN